MLTYSFLSRQGVREASIVGRSVRPRRGGDLGESARRALQSEIRSALSSGTQGKRPTTSSGDGTEAARAPRLQEGEPEDSDNIFARM